MNRTDFSDGSWEIDTRLDRDHEHEPHPTHHHLTPDDRAEQTALAFGRSFVRGIPGSISWQTTEAISRGRVEAVLDLVAGREPDAAKAWERAQTNEVRGLWPLFSESYWESVKRLGQS
mgnify:CR=1 FL=1